MAQGVPFAREYGGLLDTRSFGGAQVSRTFYARGQTGQQLLLGAYQALERQIAAGTVEMHSRHEMLDLIVVDGRARGIVARDLITGEITTDFADAVVLATGGYGNVFFLSTNAKGSNVTATGGRTARARYFANPCYTQIHPTCIPVSGDHQSKLTLMSESLRNDGRVWVPKTGGDTRAAAARSPRTSATTTWSASTRRSATWSPATSPPAPPRTSATRAAASAPAASASTWTSPTRSRGWAGPAVEAKYGNLFEMYERITGEDPYQVPMRIYPAVHYTMGGLWVDYDLQSTIPGLFVIGEANFSDHGANRLGASALMQGLADGYFVLPTTINDYLADELARQGRREPPRGGRGAHARLRSGSTSCSRSTATAPSTRSTASSARSCGSTAAWRAPRRACARRSTGSAALREEFWQRVKVPGTGDELNQSLEKAGRVADFLELAELMCLDALHREESCGGHFRAEHQTPDGEAERDDEQFSYVAAWEYGGDGARRCCTRKTWTSSTSTRPSGATSEPDPAHLAPDRPERQGPDGRPTRSTTSRRTCRSWRCSTSSTSS